MECCGTERLYYGVARKQSLLAAYFGHEACVVYLMSRCPVRLERPSADYELFVFEFVGSFCVGFEKASVPFERRNGFFDSGVETFAFVADLASYFTDAFFEFFPATAHLFERGTRRVNLGSCVA
jgi:hypothetical protein